MIFTIKTTRGSANKQILDICKDISRLSPTNHRLLFDLTQYGETTPFSNLVLINSLRRYRVMHPELEIKCRPKDYDGYLSHIGFYRTMNIPIGKEPGEARANPNYVPITKLDFKPSFYYDIDRLCESLAATIKFDSNLQKRLTYIFQETIRNAYEHAETNNVLVAAQNWPKLNLVEIAIADTGCGVATSLKGVLQKMILAF